MRIGSRAAPTRARFINLRTPDVRRAASDDIVLKPNPDDMRSHLLALFSGEADGVIELAWTDPGARNVARGKLFAQSDIDHLIYTAALMNGRESNVYVGPALRPCEPRDGRTTDDDAGDTEVVWVDLDDEGAAAAAVETCAELGIPPSTWLPGCEPRTHAARAKLRALRADECVGRGRVGGRAARGDRGAL